MGSSLADAECMVIHMLFSYFLGLVAVLSDTLLFLRKSMGVLKTIHR